MDSKHLDQQRVERGKDSRNSETLLMRTMDLGRTDPGGGDDFRGRDRCLGGDREADLRKNHP